MVRPIRKNMLSYLPKYYDDSKVVLEIMESEGTEFSWLKYHIDEVLDQMFIDKATWGLSRWEKLLGLVPPQDDAFNWDEMDDFPSIYLNNHEWGDFESTTNEEQFIEERRSRIKSRLRGYGTVTKEFIKNVVQSFANGEVEVIEDNANYTITIKFIDTVGIPSGLDQAKKAIDEIIPAHIGVIYLNKYSLWQDIKVTTWGNIKNYKWQDIKGGLWNA